MCRARRVKCDEQRPACQKCVTTGRKCEGYQSVREWVVIVGPPRTDTITDIEDARSSRLFDYFRTQAVHELSWFFDGVEWAEVVLREAQGSLAVRHAVIALACEHEERKERRRGGERGTPPQHQQHEYAAQHYSKAIRNLIKETSDGARDSRPRALVCGLLFISFEALRGNDTAAANHLEACLKIVREARGEKDMVALKGALLARDIRPVGARLDERMLDERAELDEQVENLSSGSFSSVHEAVETLYSLGERFHRYNLPHATSKTAQITHSLQSRRPAPLTSPPRSPPTCSTRISAPPQRRPNALGNLPTTTSPYYHTHS